MNFAQVNLIFLLGVFVAMGVFLAPTMGCAADSSVRIDAATTQEPISPYVYGQFIEHLGRCIYGGIWAEMLEDRKFYYPVDGKQSGWEMHKGKDVSWEGHGIPYEILIASPWQIIGPPDAVTMNTTEPFVGNHDPVITLAGEEPRGIYHPRLALEKGREYVGYIILKSTGEISRVEVALQWGDAAEAVTRMDVSGNTFNKYDFTFTADEDKEDGRLAIRCFGNGAVHIGAVSLMPADNVDGFRKDTLALLRELNAPVYRWPGGNFVSGYDWRDGIGDRDKRPPRKNPAWTGIEHNDMGIHEYMHFCELINTEPFVALNTGLGDVASASAEVEYITGAADTTEGAKRAANGHPEPWNAKWWAVGNEMYGDWQLGHMPLEEYVKKHNAMVDAIRAVSPEAQCIGVGSAGKWSETMLTHCADHMELLSEHLYWQRKDDVTDHVLTSAKQIEKLADTHRKYRKDIAGLKEKDIRIALDEWNYWYGPYIYGELGTRYFMRDALGCAAALHAMFRNSDLFFMANYAQTVNVIGAIKTSKESVALETTGLVLKLYRHHFGTLPVKVATSPTIDASAAWSSDKKMFTIAVVNPTTRQARVPLSIDGVSLRGTGTRYVIAGDPMSHNDPSDPFRVVIRESPLGAVSDTLELDACSVTLLSLDVN